MASWERRPSPRRVAAAKAAAATRSSAGSWGSHSSGWGGDTTGSSDAGGSSGWRDGAGVQGTTGSTGWRDDKRVSWSADGWAGNAASTSSWSVSSTWSAKDQDKQADADPQAAANQAAFANHVVPDASSEAPATIARPADAAELITPEAAALTGETHGASASANRRGVKRKDQEAADTLVTLEAPVAAAAISGAATAVASADLAACPQLTSAGAVAATEEVAATHGTTAKAALISEHAAAPSMSLDAAVAVASAACKAHQLSHTGIVAATEDVAPAAATNTETANCKGILCRWMLPLQLRLPAPATIDFVDAAALVATAAHATEDAAPTAATPEEAVKASANHEPAAETNEGVDAAATVGSATQAPPQLSNMATDDIAPAAATPVDTDKASLIHESAAVNTVVDAAPAQLVAIDDLSQAPAAAGVGAQVPAEAAASTGATHGASATADNTQGLQHEEASAAATFASAGSPLVAGDVAAVALPEVFASTTTTPEDAPLVVPQAAVAPAASAADLAACPQCANAGTVAATEAAVDTGEETAKAAAIDELAAAEPESVPHAEIAKASAANAEAKFARAKVAIEKIAAAATANVPTIHAAAETAADTLHDAANGTAASSSDNSNPQRPPAVQSRCRPTQHALHYVSLKKPQPWPRCDRCNEHVATNCHLCSLCGVVFCWKCHCAAGDVVSARQPRVIPPPPRASSAASPASGNRPVSPKLPASNKRAQSLQPGPEPKRVPVARDVRQHIQAMSRQQASVILPPEGAPFWSQIGAAVKSAPVGPPVMMPTVGSPFMSPQVVAPFMSPPVGAAVMSPLVGGPLMRPPPGPPPPGPPPPGPPLPGRPPTPWRRPSRTLKDAPTMMTQVITPPPVPAQPDLIIVPRTGAPPVSPALSGLAMPLQHGPYMSPLVGAPPPVLPAPSNVAAGGRTATVGVMSDKDTLDLLHGQGAQPDDVRLLVLLERRSEKGRQAVNCIAGPLVHLLLSTATCVTSYLLKHCAALMTATRSRGC